MWDISKDFAEDSWRQKLRGKAKAAEKTTKRLNVEAENATNNRKENFLPGIYALQKVLASVRSIAELARNRYADLEPLRHNPSGDIKVINDFLINMSPKFNKAGNGSTQMTAAELRAFQVV